MRGGRATEVVRKTPPHAQREGGGATKLLKETKKPPPHKTRGAGATTLEKETKKIPPTQNARGVEQPGRW